MSDKLRKQIETELLLLRQLLSVHQPLVEKCAGGVAPTVIETSALAAMLHSFYTGMENIFKRVTIAEDRDLPRGSDTHRELLDLMSKPGVNRPAVISSQLHEQLKEYLRFRHRFRHCYSYLMEWTKMSALVLSCPTVMASIEKELGLFLQRLG